MSTQTDTKFTPLPWRIDKMNSDGIEIVGDNGNIVHTVDFGSIPTERGSSFAESIIQEEIANAHLISSAGDLLQAAEAMDELMENLWKAVQWGKTFGLRADLLNTAPMKLKAAIAKAKGQP